MRTIALALAAVAAFAFSGCTGGSGDGGGAAWEFGRPTGEGLIYGQPVPSPNCGEPAPDRCRALQNQIWPVGADTDQCRDSDGDPHDATGRDSAKWFKFGGCGSIKEYQVDPCSWVRIRAYGDSCENCVLWHVNYVVEEKKGGSWQKIADVDPPDSRGMQHEICVQTSTGEFRIRAREGFLVEVYRR